MEKQMSCSRLKLATLAALPFLLVSADGFSQTSKQPQKKHVDTYMAREKCFAEAAAKNPGNPDSDVGLRSLRTATYMDCAKRMGFPP
jgi:hypothetical protein